MQVLPHWNYFTGPFAVAGGTQVTVNFGSLPGNWFWDVIGIPGCVIPGVGQALVTDLGKTERRASVLVQVAEFLSLLFSFQVRCILLVGF